MKRKLPADAELRNVVEFNKPYPLRIDELGQAGMSMVLHYGFKPANVDPSQPATLRISGGHSEDSNVELTTKTDSGRDLQFRGSTLASVSEYVLLLAADGQFTLKKVDKSIVNLRPQAAESSSSKKDLSFSSSEAVQAGWNRMKHRTAPPKRPAKPAAAAAADAPTDAGAAPLMMAVMQVDRVSRPSAAPAAPPAPPLPP